MTYSAEDTFDALKRIPLDVEKVNFDSIELSGLDRQDYPDFVDSFIEYAEFNNGEPLDDYQIEQLNEEESILDEVMCQAYEHQIEDYY